MEPASADKIKLGQERPGESVEAIWFSITMPNPPMLLTQNLLAISFHSKLGQPGVEQIRSTMT